ncbi:hypothetical protein N7462_004794 [Penicillium macrosclerotiorum]|uniref:uncharacterized protein n=1 Tax=Penicillium macrosclerotiorum TaxID=303699 RepID=UPI002549407A|nr:uncharacterized protein N7462_004794 [Penicillium macrosclerotiorum]KAJ5690402.1 hypothetical protein N7462_004794 [Penicillium macrosclerotiorum]
MAELGLAIFATIDLCFKQGKTLVDLCRALQGAKSKVAEIALDIERHWLQTKLKLEFLEKINESMDEEHRDIQNRTLLVLVEKLSAANTTLDKIVTRTPKDTDNSPSLGVSKWRYLLYRENLEEALKELEAWQQKFFDPGWYLTLRIPNPQIDMELSKGLESSKSGQGQALMPRAQNLRNATVRDVPARNIFLDATGLESARVLNMQFTSAKMVQRHGSSHWLVIDEIFVNPRADITRLTRDIRNLASKLSGADPRTFGLLTCYGVVPKPNRQQPTSFAMIFRTPEYTTDGETLRKRLVAGQIDHSLSDRLEIAKDLARSVFYIHAHGFVHKNIRPETILLLRKDPSDFGSSFLLGLENFRNADGASMRYGDLDWERNLYRHPRRIGLTPQDDYIMQHDIYSLGVCLLELGMWETFVQYDKEDAPYPSSLLRIEVDQPGALNSLQGNLVSISREILPKRMGTKYSRIVETCLTCLEENNADFGDEREFDDDVGVRVAVRYIQKVFPLLFPEKNYH